MKFLKTNSTISPLLPAIASTAIPLFVLILLLAAGRAGAQANCISFESPLAGSVYPTPSCTVSLNVVCPNVTKVDLQARYFPAGSDSAVIVALGTLSRPPYKLIWNTSNLPNQLFTGIGILAEATISGAASQIARQEGIFLTHQKPDRKFVPIPYTPNSHNPGKESSARRFEFSEPQKSGTAAVVWNEKELTFHVNVKDPSFYSTQPDRDMTKAGLEIMIDPARKKAPHPADNTLFFFIPIKGNPSATEYRTEISDGGFKLVPHRSRVNHQYNVGIGEFKGYNIRFSVPRDVFGKSFPDTIGCNMALWILDDNGNAQAVSLTGGNRFEMYSPFIWDDYYRLHKPLLMNTALQWIIFSIAGFLLALGVYALVTRLRKPQLLSNFERTEEEKHAFERVNTVIEQELVKKELTIDMVAVKCNMDAQALNNLIKRNTGFTFMNYLQFCRTEVAKERLRSSRTTEKSIADLCGFANAIEMEKCFTKFHHTTPYKFRIQQQVS
ncbi:MAG: helix-turn-helix domain-containing protein [Chitinispirillia bacterium]|nr:helix-turn-helix domain-containing protein [Chitinispirillia bacterium]MCL2267640.1 helix-turn-helix domain-containing protein [Chitinispirillia bacterium]